MSVISVMLGSKYDCNLCFETVQIWVQSWLQKGRNMTAIISVREQIWLQLLKCFSWQDSSRNEGQKCSARFSKLQSYLDPFVIRIALIFGPQHDQDCSHIWTLLKLRLQSYLDPNMSDNALINVPSYIWYIIYLSLFSMVLCHKFWNLYMVWGSYYGLIKFWKGIYLQ